MADARYVREWNEARLTAGDSVGVGEIWQLKDGRAAYYNRLASTGQEVAATSGDVADFKTSGVVTVTKATGVVLLDGGKVFWDHSANNCTYRKVNDRDFFIGTCVGDAASSDATCQVALNNQPVYDIDIARDAFDTVITGTQALGGLGLYRRGGSHKIILSSTNEAQKVDILTKDGFHKNANAIIEFVVEVVSDGSGTAVDVSIGAANDTHATDADSITDSVFMHLDANNTNINFESDDGTTEVAVTDSTIDYTEGTRFEVWMDWRNPADIQMYVNGANVLPASTFNVDASTATWKLLVHVEKTSSTDTYEIDIDSLTVRFSEQ